MINRKSLSLNKMEMSLLLAKILLKVPNCLFYSFRVLIVKKFYREKNVDIKCYQTTKAFVYTMEVNNETRFSQKPSHRLYQSLLACLEPIPF